MPECRKPSPYHESPLLEVADRYCVLGCDEGKRARVVQLCPRAQGIQSCRNSRRAAFGWKPRLLVGETNALVSRRRTNKQLRAQILYGTRTIAARLKKPRSPDEKSGASAQLILPNRSCPKILQVSIYLSAS